MLSGLFGKIYDKFTKVYNYYDGPVGLVLSRLVSPEEDKDGNLE